MHSIWVAELHVTVNYINKILSEAQQSFYGKHISLPTIKYM